MNIKILSIHRNLLRRIEYTYCLMVLRQDSLITSWSLSDFLMFLLPDPCSLHNPIVPVVGALSLPLLLSCFQSWPLHLHFIMPIISKSSIVIHINSLFNIIIKWSLVNQLEWPSVYLLKRCNTLWDLYRL